MDLVSHLTETAPKASVLLAHGFAEHSGRYSAFIAALNAADYDVWTFDFEAHGETTRKRARVNVGELIGQHLAARRSFTLQARTERKHLFGHSMGGMITLASTLLMPHHVDSVAVTGPALRPLPRVPLPLLKLSSTAARILPGVGTVKIDDTKLSHDPQLAPSYAEDPLVFTGRVPLLTGSTMAIQGDYTIKNAPLLVKPTLILHGDEDVLADPQGSVEFVEGAGGHAELRIIPGAYHELLNEVERAEYTAEIISWYDEAEPAKQ